MDDRLVLHGKLVLAFPELRVYYTPQSKLNLKYPCVVYHTKKVTPSYSNNQPFVLGTSFDVVMMSKLPDVNDLKLMLSIQGLRHVRSYVQSDIQHHAYVADIGSI